jgi:mannose-6-phosphate isomerase-like protein (cupin superfamily)
MYNITALVFSGRKNPSWEVKDEQLKAALAFFEAAEMSADHSPAASLLGYNGLQVEKGNKLWYVVSGRIFYKIDDKTVLIKKDSNGSFEKMLLKTAPAETAALVKSVME